MMTTAKPAASASRIATLAAAARWSCERMDLETPIACRDVTPVEHLVGGEVIRRRRVCQSCAKRFTTKERVEHDVKLMVVKRDGARVPYDRTKILAGVQRACYKRPIEEATLVDMVAGGGYFAAHPLYRSEFLAAVAVKP